mmetsp:Transcript_4505/g.13666  ORF Transcript_4505/g.13666 Transcript_4505/m.13666 type:complete len:290 (+) Transcript_4505:167-1036(+)
MFPGLTRLYFPKLVLVTACSARTSASSVIEGSTSVSSSGGASRANCLCLKLFDGMSMSRERENFDDAPVLRWCGSLWLTSLNRILGTCSPPKEVSCSHGCISASQAVKRCTGSRSNSPSRKDRSTREARFRRLLEREYFALAHLESVIVFVWTGGSSPVSKVCKQTPQAHMSTGAPYGCFMRISGAKWSQAPYGPLRAKFFAVLSPYSAGRSITAACPNSASLMPSVTSSVTSRMFSILTLRWTMSASCSCEIAFSSERMTACAVSSSAAPSLLSQVSRVPPPRYSVTM